MPGLKLDKTDLQIIKILQTNSKITNLQLSKRIGLSPAPTLERVRKLENSGVIASYHARIDPAVVGFQVQTFVLVSLDWKTNKALPSFLDKIKDIPEIVECHIITGEADCLLKIIATDIPSYERLLFNTLTKLDEIERLKTLMTLSTPKQLVLLPLDYGKD
ncbi:MAG: Lrp/AsnC family transcriptional regulator [Saprospiraceae bacterium]|nr:Lrp/AsnC family transcriptional regulator [Saprospiraceae bacterium]